MLSPKTRKCLSQLAHVSRSTVPVSGSKGPGQKSLALELRYCCAASLRLPSGSYPPNQTAPAKIEETSGSPDPGSTLGTIYFPSVRFHHTSPPARSSARTLLILISISDRAGAQSARYLNSISRYLFFVFVLFRILYQPLRMDRISGSRDHKNNNRKKVYQV